MDTPAPASAPSSPQPAPGEKLLWMLATGHYVLGGWNMILGVLFLVLPFVVTYVPQPDVEIRTIQMAGFVVFLLMLGMGVLAFLCGKRLMAWERQNFCRIVVLIEFALAPLAIGLNVATIGRVMILFLPCCLLGFGTLLVLRRPEVQARFRS